METNLEKAVDAFRLFVELEQNRNVILCNYRNAVNRMLEMKISDERKLENMTVYETAHNERIADMLNLYTEFREQRLTYQELHLKLNVDFHHVMIK